MAREITILQIPKVMEEAVETLVQATTLEWTSRVKKATPVDTGRLRNSWQTDIKKFKGRVSNNLPYAEPVCFGENLPPSWGGQYRTRQATVAGYPELIAKELQSWADGEYKKIVGNI